MNSVALESVLEKLKKVEDIRVKPIDSDFFVSPQFYRSFNDNYIGNHCTGLLNFIIERLSNSQRSIFSQGRVAIVSGISEGFLGKSLALGNLDEAIPLGEILRELKGIGYRRIIFDVDSLVRVDPAFLEPETSKVLYLVPSKKLYGKSKFIMLK